MPSAHPRLTIALLAAALSAAACGETTAPGSTPVASMAVGVEDNRFTPPANTVRTGEAVTWTWAGANPHNVTFDDSAITGSPTRTTGEFSITFPDAGEYTYYCTVHGRTMSGRVVVTAGGAESSGGASGY